MDGCSISPTVYTRWKTAYVNGQTYRGNTIVATISGPTYFTYIFPDLILTLLTPGELMTQVIGNQTSLSVG